MLPVILLVTFIGKTPLDLVGMNFHSCEQIYMFKNEPYKLHLQILRFGVKLTICLCSGTDASKAVLKNGIRNRTIGREIGIVELMGYMNLKGIQGRGKIFLLVICF